MQENPLIVKVRQYESALQDYRGYRRKLWKTFERSPEAKVIKGNFFVNDISGSPFKMNVEVARNGTDFDQDNVRVTIKHPVEDGLLVTLYDQWFPATPVLGTDEILAACNDPSMPMLKGILPEFEAHPFHFHAAEKSSE